jgi:DNA-directed DNA polymerase III PolC
MEQQYEVHVNYRELKKQYINLHVHTPFSFYEGAARIEEIVETAAKNNSSAIAFTDRNRISGLIKGYKSAREHGIKPVLGLLLDDPAKASRNALLWAKNIDGYSEICRLSSERLLNIDFNLDAALKTVSKNVIVATSVKSLLEDLRKTVLPGNLYGNLKGFQTSEERQDAGRLFEICKRLEIPLVATNPITCVSEEQKDLAKLLRSIGSRCALLHRARNHNYSRIQSLEESVSVIKQYSGVEDAILNTSLIAEQCEVDLQLGKLKFPEPILESDIEPFVELRRRAEDGMRRRYGPVPPQVVIERIAYELGVIDHLGFTGYMIVVHDIATKAWNNGVRTLGRGSAANSIICYCLELTDICPIKYDLYFERFLNPERSSPPDIDLDFSWRDRDAILHGVYDTYGDDRVAMIGTTVTFAARAALRETALAHGLPNEEIRKITKSVPFFSRSKNLSALKDENPACANLPFDKEPWKSIAEQAQALIGLPRHLSIHAGGVVIAPAKINQWTGTERASKGFVITQYDMYGIEDLGLVKIDLLSQRALGVLKDTVRMVVENEGEEAKPPVDDIELVCAEPATRELLRSGKTMGVFYVESPGMIALLKKLDCDNYDLLVAASSVIRPGVSESGMMQQFIERVRDPSIATYLHPKMKKLLGETHGVMIYQEDVLKVAHHIAGLPLGRADLLRRAMSGKYRSSDAIQKLQDQFLSGCLKNGVTKEIAKEIWRQIVSFAGYSFCKAHSASFAVLSMQIAYLKRHHPAEFFASVLANHGGFYSQAAYIEEAHRWEIKISLPNINKSELDHFGKGDTIFLGLNSIGSLKESSLQRIVDDRSGCGEYKNLGDFIRRIEPSRDEMEAIISCGGMDSIGPNRPTLLRNFKAGFESYKNGPGPLATEAEDIFSGLTPAADWSDEEKYVAEKRIMGYSPGAHPLTLMDLPDNGEIHARFIESYEGHRITMIGWAFSHKKIQTRAKKETMEFLSLEDLTGNFEVTLFPRIYSRYATILRGSGPFRVSGRVDNDHGVCTLIADSLENLSAHAPRNRNDASYSTFNHQ